HTVAFVALKPGLVLEPGRRAAGTIEVVDIGLDPGSVDVHALEDGDVAGRLRPRPVDDHKWRSAVRVVGGAPGMTGAAAVAARAAQRCGAGLVQLALPGGRGGEGPTEAVEILLPRENWGVAAFADLDPRVRAVLLGPGLAEVEAAALAAAAGTARPLVVDGGALGPDTMAHVAARSEPTILTPHDGEWVRLGGSPDPDRIDATQRFARQHGVTVVRKGPTTIVAGPDGRAEVVTAGGSMLATAGTGDVLAGCAVALLARGLDGPTAGAVAAHVHGRAGRRCGSGLVASELADEVGSVMAYFEEEKA
ncbi:MAG: ADP-dependent NAD(P)H-hydrate dehydratase, partial [Ilumatobacteraceae bacterium]